MPDVLQLSAFKDNYIWLLRKGATAIVVDPGDAAPVLACLQSERLQLEAILITHHHQDHQGGTATLLEHFPGATVYGPARESITALKHPLRGGERLHFASHALDLTVIAVPGHTLGHLAYYGDGCLFCGDTLFAGGCGRVFEGTPGMMFDSLCRLAALPEETLVYCAHEYTEGNLRFALAVEPGNKTLRRRADEVAVLRAKGLATVPSTLMLEKSTNPFLRCGQADVVEAVRQHGAPAAAAVEVFAALREWKNGF